MSKCLDICPPTRCAFSRLFDSILYWLLKLLLPKCPDFYGNDSKDSFTRLLYTYIIYIHKRFICSSGLKYIKKSNSGKPQIICLKCFSLSKRNLETKYIYHKVYILDHALFIAQSFIFYHTTVALGCLIHIWQNVYLVAKSPTNSNVCTYVAKHRNLTIW